jgi:hypothetical protein
MSLPRQVLGVETNTPLCSSLLQSGIYYALVFAKEDVPQMRLLLCEIVQGIPEQRRSNLPDAHCARQATCVA